MGADAVRIRMSYVAESVYGTHPGGTIKDLRLVSESLNQETTVVNSAEIRNDRKVAYVARTDLRAVGNIEAEMSYSAYDDLFQFGLLSAAWTTPASPITGAIYSITGGNTLHRSAGSFTTDFPALAVGHWIRMAGFATAANNSWFKVSTITATDIGLTAGVPINEAAGASVTITQGSFITDGTTFKSVTVERQYTDLTNEYAIFKGLAFEQVYLTAEVGQIMKSSFECLGANEVSATASGGSGYTTAPTNDVMNTVDNVHAICENNLRFTGVQQFAWTLKNNLRARTQIATLGAVSIGTGTVDLTGVFRSFYNDKTQIDRYLNFTTTSLSMTTKDNAGNVYVMDFPSVKFTTGRRVAGGINTDIFADMTFSAFRHPTEAITMRMTRFAGP